MKTGVDGRRQRTVASREHILDAAEIGFGSGGFDGTSIRSIAASIGMTHAGVLRHFPSKEHLLIAMLERVDARAIAHYEQHGFLELPLRDRIAATATYRLSVPHGVPLYTVLLGEGISPAHPAHDYIAQRSRRVQQEFDQVDTEHGRTLFAVLDGLQLLSLYLPDRVDVFADLGRYAASLDSAVMPPDVATVHAPRREIARTPATREGEIITAAAAAFARGGYRATSLREIASTLGTSHGGLLYHFASKQALLEAVLDQRDSNDLLPWSIGDGALDYLCGMYLQAVHNANEPGLTAMFSTLACEATDPEHPAHDYFRQRYSGFHRELAGHLASLVDSGVARTDLDAAAEAATVIALWDGLALHQHYVDGIDLPEMLRRHLSSLLTVALPRL